MIKMMPPADYAGLIQCTTPTMSGKSYEVSPNTEMDVEACDSVFFGKMGFTVVPTAFEALPGVEPEPVASTEPVAPPPPAPPAPTAEEIAAAAAAAEAAKAEVK